MNINTAKSLKNILIATSFKEKIDQINALQQRVDASFPAPLHQHCHVANLREGCLILAVDSSAWATQLRFRTPDLLEKLRRYPELSDLRGIKHFIQPV